MIVGVLIVLVVKLVCCSENRSEVSTLEEYPHLNFKIPAMQNPFLWDKEMEIRYLNGLQNWKETPLRVFIVPFSHNDAGWIFTFEEYFEKSSRNILDHIANLLPTLEKFTFVWSEICFLERWWARADTVARRKMCELVKSGQLEIVTGAWVMPDEATTTVFALLDQLVEGNQWVYNKFGVEVFTSWSIDQFGVGSTWPYLLSQCGMNFTLAQRVHWAWKRHLAWKRQLDMIWRTVEDDKTTDIRLRVQPTPSYSVAASCGPDKNICAQFDYNPDISDALPIKFLNIRQRVETLMGQYGRLGSMTDTNTALITLGTDFRYENRSEWMCQYFNYKAIMEYVNSNFDLYHSHIQFATLKDYVALTPAPKTLFTGDFFVYSDLGPDNKIQSDYWSGYYTTRPYWKLLGRKLESTLRTAEILFSFCRARRCNVEDTSQETELTYSKLIYCRDILGLFQHHDAITGTSTAHVMADFERKLKRAIRYARQVEETCCSLVATKLQEPSGLTRIPRDKIINKFPTLICIFNSLMVAKMEVVSLRVSRTDLIVYDITLGVASPHQINFCNLSDDFELVFTPTLGALTLSTFIVAIGDDGRNRLSKVYKLMQQEAHFNFTIKTHQQALIFNSGSGLMTGYLTREGDHIPLDISVKAYESEPTRSGAYLFRPKSETLKLNTSLSSKNIYVLEGPLYKDVVTNYGDTFSIRTRSFEKQNLLSNIVEITTVTDLGPRKDNVNLEISLKISTNRKKTKFFTDVNGFNYRERVFIEELGVAGNYYPMTEEAYLESEEGRLTLLADHSHGVASLAPGEIEVMLDRRTLLDDLRGLGEGVLDEKRSKSRFLLFKSDIETAVENSYLLSLHLNHDAPSFLCPLGVSIESRSLVSHPLPANIHFLNFKTLPSKDGTPSNIILMTLLRKSSTNSCRTNEAFFNNTVFYDLNPQTMSRSLLNGLAEFESFITLNELQISPFSIVAVKLYF